MEMHDTAKLKKVDSAISTIVSEEDALHTLAKPMRNRLDIEELKKEQGFKPIDKKAFFKKIERLNIKEPIEELLAMI